MTTPLTPAQLKAIFTLAIAFALCMPIGALAQSVPASFCHAEEKTYFSCHTKNGKTVAVCGSPNLADETSHLQYRYGRLDQSPELSFPKDFRAPLGLFEFSNAGMGAKASVRNLRFHIGAYTYTVFSYSSVYEPDTAGVVVSRGSDKATWIQCKADRAPWARGATSIELVDDEHFHELQNLGLPEVPRDELAY